MRKLFTLAFYILVLASCHNKINADAGRSGLADTISNDKKQNLPKRNLLYNGTLPCADCEGIETVLKIDIVDNKFELSSRYKGKTPEKTFIEKGNLNTERGLEDDSDGTIFILNWDKPEKDQIYYGYYSKNPEKLFLLDKSKNVIKSKLNYFIELSK